jgi:hypothetical protein
VLGRAAALYEELVARRPGDEKLRDNLARGYFGLGFLYDHNARLDEAETAYRRAAALQEALASAHPG